jgi:hypothetical protein
LQVLRIQKPGERLYRFELTDSCTSKERLDRCAVLS